MGPSPISILAKPTIELTLVSGVAIVCASLVSMRNLVVADWWVYLIGRILLVGGLESWIMTQQVFRVLGALGLPAAIATHQVQLPLTRWHQPAMAPSPLGTLAQHTIKQVATVSMHKLVVATRIPSASLILAAFLMRSTPAIRWEMLVVVSLATKRMTVVFLVLERA